MDRRSPWHVSALFATALESMTLPARLKPMNGIRYSLDELAASLNVNGNQNIAKLQMSISSRISDEETNGTNGVSVDARPGRLDVRNGGKDTRIPSQDGRAVAMPTVENDEVPFDMDLFPSEEPNVGRRRPSNKRSHTFGQVEAYRGEDAADVHEPDDFDGQERARRRAAGLPIVHK